MRTKYLTSDRLGWWSIICSGVCLVHCLLPVLLTLVWSLLGLQSHSGYHHHHHHGVHDLDWMLHLGLLAVLLPSGLAVFYSGYQRHGLKRVLFLSIVGFLLMSLNILQVFPENLSFWSGILGTVFLVLAHWQNLKHRQCCHHA